MNQQKLKNIFNLDSKERYGYLIRKTADFESIYLIADHVGSYVTIGDKNEICIPVWPESDFANFMVKELWPGYGTKKMNIYEFIDWQDELSDQKIYIAGFPDNNLNSVIVSPGEIKNHLIYECSKYE
ncbi:MAG: DUF2750 domain-containing protein [Bacteroidetes bacterium]|nr:MAG: DUF2750 domain-containing protein [Bacteroidota bacterium]